MSEKKKLTIEEQQYLIPVDHLSYSAIRQFLANEIIFKKTYIEGRWDRKEHPSSMVGTAFHLALENYYNGMGIDDAIEQGHLYIDSIPGDKVEWGKTGSVGKVHQSYYFAIQNYLKDEPKWKVLCAERDDTVPFEFPGEIKSPVPIKAKTDLIVEIDGDLVGVDYKTTSRFTDLDKEKGNYILQSIANYIACKSEYELKRFIFLEVKPTKSGGTQWYEIKFDEVEHYFKLFYKVTSLVINELADPNHKYKPNFSDFFSGDEALTEVLEETLDFEQVKQIKHKSEDEDNISRRKFMKSKIQTAAAQDMTVQEKIITKLREFNVRLQFEDAIHGANVTLLTFTLDRGLKVREVQRYEDDVSLAIQSRKVRIYPVFGTDTVGIEVPNLEQKVVLLPEELLKHGEALELPIGVNVYGDPYFLNLSKAPHLLIAGATGSGKSVLMNVIIKTLESKGVELQLVDPKGTEFFLYDNVIESSEEFAEVSEQLVTEMQNRYTAMRKAKTRKYTEAGFAPKVVIVDELADLMLSKEFGKMIELNLVRLAQKARAAGIHLILATQRPSVDVLTGILKANLPTRIGLRTASQVDSQVILDQKGCERLMGNGDSLLLTPGEQQLVRLQGYFSND